MPALRTYRNTLYLFHKDRKNDNKTKTHHSFLALMTESSATTKTNIHRVEFSLGCVRNACLVPDLSSSPFFLIPTRHVRRGQKKREERDVRNGSSKSADPVMVLHSRRRHVTMDGSPVGLPWTTINYLAPGLAVNLTTSLLRVVLATCHECLAVCPRNSRSTTFPR